MDFNLPLLQHTSKCYHNIMFRTHQKIHHHKRIFIAHLKIHYHNKIFKIDKFSQVNRRKKILSIETKSVQESILNLRIIISPKKLIQLPDNDIKMH